MLIAGQTEPSSSRGTHDISNEPKIKLNNWNVEERDEMNRIRVKLVFDFRPFLMACWFGMLNSVYESYTNHKVDAAGTRMRRLRWPGVNWTKQRLEST